MIYSIDTKKLDKLTNTIDGKVFYGASQNWYPTFIQRLSGCGPTTASNLYASLNDDIQVRSKNEWIVVMQSLWNYVTPGLKGLNKVEDFTKGCNSFFLEHHLPYVCQQLKFSSRVPPSMDEISLFISSALKRNQPVAFLNLNNGQIKDLDSWHWVTIVQLKIEDVSTFVTVFDGDKTFEMDLKQWRETTRNRGGFAHFSRSL